VGCKCHSDFQEGVQERSSELLPSEFNFTDIFERIVKAKIINFLETNRLICNSQHGFIQKRSCLTNLLEFMDLVL